MTNELRRLASWDRYVPTAAVALAAAAVTAHGLVEVASAARVPEPMAWAYPVITDGLALVAYRATSRLSPPGARYAWVVVVIAAGMSGLAQAVYLASDALVASAGLRFGVGAWPAVAAAVAAHLLHLLTENHDGEPTLVGLPSDGTTADGEHSEQCEREHQEPHAPTAPDDLEPLAPGQETGPEPDDVDPRVRELAVELAAGAEITGEQAGQRYGLSTRSGRRLVGQARTHLEAAAPRADPGARTTTAPLHLVTEGTGS